MPASQDEIIDKYINKAMAESPEWWDQEISITPEVNCVYWLSC